MFSLKTSPTSWLISVPSSHADRREDIEIHASPDGLEIEYTTISWEDLYTAMCSMPGRRKWPLTKPDEG